MSDPRMSAEAVAPGNVIHFCSTFGLAGRTAPTACGRVEQPKPASDDWRQVSCEACLRLSSFAALGVSPLLIASQPQQHPGETDEEFKARVRTWLEGRRPSTGGTPL